MPDRVRCELQTGVYMDPKSAVSPTLPPPNVGV
jgi:hypothetical protein